MSGSNVEEGIRAQFDDSIAVFRYLTDKAEFIENSAQLMIRSLKTGGKLLICGNGGSASDAQHFAAELVGRFLKNRPPLAAIALSTDTSIITAVANDFSYDQIFSRQIEALGNPGDVLVGLSTSGNSANVINAVYAARDKGIQSILLSGKGGGKLAELTDHALVVPSDFSARIQEGHIAIIHVWCKLIEDSIFPPAQD
jgi:D-sedoheptulose 7-phosphate isomerase